MAPAVPFALLGVVQLAAVAVWLGFAAACCFPGLIRRTTPLVVVASMAMAAADVLTALHLDVASSDGIALLRVIGLLLLLIGLADGAPQRPTTVLPAITAPLGARLSLAIAGGAVGAIAACAALVRGLRPGGDRRIAGWLAGGIALTATAAALAGPSSHSTNAALAQLSARAAACVAMAVAIGLVARASLLGKIVGAIVAGVVAMAIGAVAVVGIGVAAEVQRDQSSRLYQVATSQQRNLQSLETQAGEQAQLLAICIGTQTFHRCGQALQVFSENPGYFAAVYQPGKGVKLVAPSPTALENAALVQLAGSKVVHDVVRLGSTYQTVGSGAILLPGAPAELAIISAVANSPSPQIKPTLAAVYGIGIVDSYLSKLANEIGYDVSIIADGYVLSSSLDTPERAQVLSEDKASRIESQDPTVSTVVPAEGTAPTVAFVPITAPGNDNVRIATLAVSQPASAALAAQRSVLRRLVLTALAVLLAIAIFAFLMAQRIADPVRRLTAAAGRVRGGDLDTAVAIESTDEVGELARAFDAMTSSLRGLTGDLREAAELEARLRARLETVVSSMTDGLLTTDGRGVVVAANPMALELLACRESDIIGGQLASVVDVRGSDGSALLAPGRSQAVADGLLARADGEPIAVRVSRAPLAGQPGEVVVISDRTREREIERLKTEFLSNVSHELRTPLTPIRGYAEMLSKRPDLPPQRVQSFVAEILAGTVRMSRAVELLVDVAALDAGRVSPTRDQVVVAELVDDRLAEWRERYPDRAADLRRRVAAKLPAVEVDPRWLAKALDELADNAVKYTAPGTPITLGASRAGDGAVSISVRDAGEGIDTDRLAELLGDFSQADASDTRKVGGMGLGLGFVTRVADALGLTLEVSSEPGKGSEFSIEVPTVSSA
ncbi:MAG TPA: ATP-binding protein [Mycobacteriales bacterium]|nr:ATP-binding protein [Mycobacteriales bacterium]HVW80689.1 ATP-binding protein [Mycobacteriales bacterium]